MRGFGILFRTPTLQTQYGWICIRRFDLNEGNLPLNFQLGLVFADGLRNEVGLAFDRHGILWGVENGAD